jgi:hypothetical protein
MSALGGKADLILRGNPLSRSLLGAMRTCPFALHMSANDPKRTSRVAPHMSAFGGEADIALRRRIAKYSPKLRCWEHKMGEDKRATGRCLCGSVPLYTVSPVHPEVLYVKAGTLDDPSLVQPRRQNWMQSRVSWTTIDPGLPGSPKNPEGRA